MDKTTGNKSSSHARRFSRKLWYGRWWLLALAWMGVIYFLSDQSTLVLPAELWWSDLLSWLAHFFEYAILAGLLWLAARSSPALPQHAGLIAVAIAALYALSDEVHQSFVPGRVPDIRDWLVDLAGAALVVWLLSRHRR